MLPELNEELVRSRIARRIAREFHDGAVVNLGIGIPTLVSDYIPEDVRVVFQTENGVVGAGPAPEVPDLRFIGAGGRHLTLLPGSALVSSDLSFGLIRGGHVDATVLGALEVSQDGDLANWMVPGKMVPGMGGAMDLVTGARQVIIATTHTTKKGDAKILKECTLPLTAKGVVSLVVTEFAVFRICEGKMELAEIAPDVTLEDLKAVTEAEYTVADPLPIMQGTEEE
ncbi:MAG: 3-oxoacid CoA-transferase subunit B [Synergistaceae bacterium]|jgi:3-oxoacid CoA-transferase subunit B/acetate CoA/acetoacetate CoA-transferase beta subunit|nr:3-oxoacid CoA-transferase subunit B [Synergistaceae bacterium]